MDLWVVKYASRRSRIWDFSGDSSVRGAWIRGVLASHASAGQRGLSAQGVNRMGGGRGRDQSSIARPRGRSGGARADESRWVSNRVCCQANLGFQGLLDLSMAFMMLSSLSCRRR
jgi:hypothetical protein